MLVFPSSFHMKKGEENHSVIYIYAREEDGKFEEGSNTWELMCLWTKEWNIMMKHMIKTTSNLFSQVVYVVKCMHIYRFPLGHNQLWKH